MRNPEDVIQVTIVALIISYATIFYALKKASCNTAEWFNALKKPFPVMSYNTFIAIWLTLHISSTQSAVLYLWLVQSTIAETIYVVTLILYSLVLLVSAAWLIHFITFRYITTSLILSIFQVGISAAITALYGVQCQWLSFFASFPFLLWTLAIIYYNISIVIENMNIDQKQTHDSTAIKTTSHSD